MAIGIILERGDGGTYPLNVSEGAAVKGLLLKEALNKGALRVPGGHKLSVAIQYVD